MTDSQIYVGLDVHKDTIAIAYAEAQSREDPKFLGTTVHRVPSLVKALAHLGSPEALGLCYEAGPCGYALARELIQRGYHCEVIAPSRVARQPADRIKTDRRDALLLARLHRAGELTAVTIPEPRDEALRDLVRAREAAMRALKCARQQLRAFLLRHGHPYTGKRAWGPQHARFLATIALEDPAQQLVFAECQLAVRSATEQLQRLDAALREQAEDWRWNPLVKALMTLRGVDFLSAVSLVAETGDLRRFGHPRALMSYLGLVPSEYSSGPSHQRGAITKTGNRHVRRLLIEAAWAYRLPARIGESIQPRLVGQPQAIVATAWKAQQRLCHRFRRLRARGLHHNKTCVAVARELCAFIWSIAQQVTIPTAVH